MTQLPHKRDGHLMSQITIIKQCSVCSMALCGCLSNLKKEPIQQHINYKTRH